MSPFRFLAALSAALCCLLSLPARADLKVVATLPDLAALAKAVGGEHVQVTAMALSTQDPHFVDARPNLALELNRADLLLSIGLELEIGWLPTLQNGARNQRILSSGPGFLDVSQFVTSKREVPQTPTDRSNGDVHPGGNPHYLYDPNIGLVVAQGIAEKMIALDAKNAEAYRANLAKFTDELKKAIPGWQQRLAGLKGTPIVAYHRTTAYLSAWLGFDTIAYLEPKPGIPPTPAHVAQVLAQARQRKARMVLREEYYPASTSKLVADKIPAPLVVLPGGTNFRGGETYPQHIEDVVTRLEKGLKGQGS
ncbi:Zinc ABC transporter, periplasmic-binding protein ZnuA [Cystobacter fuscus DSM 2262]|uniref:Zinc ABC transporter, periplasmic-binding protein ZnuA n=1 Tax=Cystobacter fuscus (strain ATCC 25194 / DSM 2262 / NBRC 100088 / M29) TaxID=1242864 RepID=S9NTD7_CYSF2|nr:metal ABC transporter substrate-binding protein [Cystobacter fuscus]EPX55400.1 Zinc ABC transporter, periplasmic-binding protein ZnuA [Cystobacter fuscus DSM 2262]